ncbi:MAG: MBL fold metallo-hydrolase [Chlamydiales bacterium]|nr:MBL fold metallo-hydrolase [Chlamydiales bacterium]
MQGTFTLLGTGASTGVPVIGCNCKVCTSTSEFNKRLRTSALLEVQGKHILIDSGPDFRIQALKYGIEKLDAMILTHTHFDHIAGIDELRIYTFRQKRALPCILSAQSYEEIKIRYYYLFKEKNSKDNGSASLAFQALEKDRGIVELFGLPITYFSYLQGNMPVNGIRIGNFAYVTDIQKYSESIFEDLYGVEILVVSALRESASFIHFNLEEAISFARKVNAKKVYLTHLSHELDYKDVSSKLPPGVHLGFDGLKIHFTLD